MFLKEDCFRLGHISRLHGYKGEVSISLDVENPQEYKNLESVFVEIDGKLIPFFLEHILLRNKGFAVVKFETVGTENKALKLLKKELYLPLAILPDDADEKKYLNLVGFSVIDSNHGNIGTVERILDLSGNEVIQINYKGTEVLIPYQDDFINKIDTSAKELHIEAPEGLIEMYLGN